MRGKTEQTLFKDKLEAVKSFPLSALKGFFFSSPISLN